MAKPARSGDDLLSTATPNIVKTSRKVRTTSIINSCCRDMSVSGLVAPRYILLTGTCHL
jgi:hypothetical protein